MSLPWALPQISNQDSVTSLPMRYHPQLVAELVGCRDMYSAETAAHHKAACTLQMQLHSELASDSSLQTLWTIVTFEPSPN